MYKIIILKDDKVMLNDESKQFFIVTEHANGDVTSGIECHASFALLGLSLLKRSLEK